MARSLDCIVLGAGPAGLIAGVTLREAGRDVMVLEARDRIGGRAHSGVLSDGTPIERGAQVVHGPTVATWEFIVRFGLTTHFRRRLGNSAIFRGGEWTLGTVPAIEEAYERLEEVLSVPNADTLSLHDALLAAGFSAIQMEAVEATMRVMSPIEPQEVSVQHALESWRLIQPQNPNFSIVEGYRRLWEELSRPIAGVICLSTPVTAIDWSSGRVVVYASGQQFEARTAILTLPVGVLQAGTVEFRPPLPEGKLAAIHGLRMGIVIKVIAEFRRPWWEEQLGQVSSFRKVASIFSGFSSHFWNRPGPPTLITYIGAGPAKEVSGDSDQIRAMYLSDLGAMFPDVDLESELVSLDIVDWPADPWARGGYSVAPVGAYHLRADLGAPTPPLFWAGEAVAQGGSAETVHGALETGRRAAIEVLHAVQPLYVGDPETRLDWWDYNPRMH